MISGSGGVGKTSLAVQWAHRVAGRFPDGQLYADLRGFDPTGAPANPTGTARDFLLALGVPADEIPVGTEAMLAGYRSLLAQRRVLVVLDNVRDVPQVRPLLPEGSRSLAVITSRNRLCGLVAQAFPLDVLDAEESMELFGGRVGADRVADEPAAAQLQAVLSYRHYQADVLVRLADMLVELGETESARGYLGTALDIYDELGFAKADDVRALLARL